MTVFLHSNFNGEGWLEPPLSYPVQTIYDAAGSVFLDSLGCALGRVDRHRRAGTDCCRA